MICFKCKKEKSLTEGICPTCIKRIVLNHLSGSDDLSNASDNQLLELMRIDKFKQSVFENIQKPLPGRAPANKKEREDMLSIFLGEGTPESKSDKKNDSRKIKIL